MSARHASICPAETDLHAQTIPIASPPGCGACASPQRAFDAMRQVLPDTDLYIGALHD
jgi:hypothetical protein